MLASQVQMAIEAGSLFLDLAIDFRRRSTTNACASREASAIES